MRNNEAIPALTRDMDGEATNLEITLPAHQDHSGGGTGPEADRALLDGWKLVVEGFQAVQESLVEELGRRFELAPGFAGVLLRLIEAPEQRMPMTQLALQSGMSSGGFTKLADRLCSAGLARRVACENDRRLTYLELTDQGQQTARATAAAAAEIVQRLVLAPLGRERFDSLAQTMRKLRDAPALRLRNT